MNEQSAGDTAAKGAPRTEAAHLSPQLLATIVAVAAYPGFQSWGRGKAGAPIETIISSAVSDDPSDRQRTIEERKAEQEWANRVRDFLKYWLVEEYKDGKLSFEDAMRRVSNLTKSLDDFDRRSILGGFSLRLLDTKAKPPLNRRGRRKTPIALRKLTTDLVKLVREVEKLPTRPGAGVEKTCYERVAELLNEFHVRLAPRTLENWMLKDSAENRIAGED